VQKSPGQMLLVSQKVLENSWKFLQAREWEGRCLSVVCVLQISKKGVAEKTVGRESGWRGLEGKELLPLVFCAF